MTAKSIAQLLTQADTTIEDNALGAISAADVRNMVKDFLDTVNTSYGIINCASAAIALVAAPAAAIKPFTGTEVVTAPFFSASLVNGTVTRVLGASANAVVRIAVSGSVEGANNALVTVHMFLNGASIGQGISLATRGAGNPVSVGAQGLIFSAVDAVVDLRANTDTPGTFTFTNMKLQCENVLVSA